MLFIVFLCLTPLFRKREVFLLIDHVIFCFPLFGNRKVSFKQCLLLFLSYLFCFDIERFFVCLFFVFVCLFFFFGFPYVFYYFSLFSFSVWK